MNPCGKSMNAKRSATRKRIGVALAGLAAVAIPVALAQVPTTNPAGITLVRESAEVWSYSEQTNPGGIKLQLTSAYDASVDTTNPAGVTAFIGQIDVEIQSNGAGVSWRMYEGETE